MVSTSTQSERLSSTLPCRNDIIAVIVLSPVSLSKKLEFVAIASAVHRDRLLLVSNAGWSEIQPLVSRGQVTSANLP